MDRAEAKKIMKECLDDAEVLCAGRPIEQYNGIAESLFAARVEWVDVEDEEDFDPAPVS